MCSVSLQQQLSHDTACVLGHSFGCFDNNASMYATHGCRGVFVCGGVHDVLCESTADGSYFPANATCSCSPEPPQIWTRPLQVGSGGKGYCGGAAALLFNAGQREKLLSVDFANISGCSWGNATTLRVRDLWAHTDVGDRTGSYDVQVHPGDSAFVMLRPNNPVGDRDLPP